MIYVHNYAVLLKFTQVYKMILYVHYIPIKLEEKNRGRKK